ncbi:MAG: AAA family ATPase [Deltaproteobacteria bacterium]|jgi:hypothetical protein|nr:AAA family ATPase [Deltaproteobacteria bacterium]
MKPLPINLQNFTKIINEGYVYVDKTPFIAKILSEGQNFFLSRPRRFGKSLFLSTLKAVFSGDEGLFKDLWIGQDNAFDLTQKFPVVYLDMALKSVSPQSLEDDIKVKLRNYAKAEDIDIEAASPGAMLNNLIFELKLKYNQRVVLLIDEYDSPISDNIHDNGLAEANRNILKYFYYNLKSREEDLRLVFVAGVTRFAFMGLSAAFNNLNDITLEDEYAGICGITLEEFDKYFSDNLSISLDKMRENGQLDEKTTAEQFRSKILKWYDGYSWDGKTKVLNPYSILCCLRKSKFSDYWIQTSPSIYFLDKIAAKNPLELLDDFSAKLGEGKLGMAEVGKLQPIPALFQTGYLTIDKSFSVPSVGSSFTLKIPNWEIKNQRYDIFTETLFNTLKLDTDNEKVNFYNALKYKDSQKLTLIFSSLFAGLPAIRHRDNESYYFKIIYGYLNGLNCLVLPELPMAIGTPDLIAAYPEEKLRAIIELKFSPDIPTDEAAKTKILNAMANKALLAIENKRYFWSSWDETTQLVKIGVGITLRGECLVLFGDGISK